MKKNNKGFTLAELLIVVAIIAVLVAISIPIFTAQLEKSRESTDAANIRSAYAEVVAAALTDPDNDHSATVEKKQTQGGWQNTSIKEIAGATTTQIDAGGAGEVTIKYTATDGKIMIGEAEAVTSFMNKTTPGGGSEAESH